VSTGYLSLLLHAHLPFVRHPEDPTVMEEAWLYEAIADTYLPQLQIFEGLVAECVPFRCTVSLSAPLLSMLDDALLRRRFAAHLDALLEVAAAEVERNRNHPRLAALTAMYRDRFHSLRTIWEAHGGDLVGAYARLQDEGVLEVITSTATHAFFPLMDRNWPAMRAQVQVAAELYRHRFGRPPPGMWLGECGFVPGVDELLAEAGVRYFVVDGHALRLAVPAPRFDVHAPIYCGSGVAAFGRDRESSEQVWSAEAGYPGDPLYRDFYRDIGFDLEREQLGPLAHPSGARLYTGIKYHAITHRELHDKELYDPQAARGRVGLHASHFRGERARQIGELAARYGRPPIVVAPYDAELFGHWWYEGPIFLGDLFRQLHFDQQTVEPLTPGEYLDRHPTQAVATPSASSWGRGGYNEYWINESNAWIYPHLHHAGERMVELARRFREPTALERRALDQAARELLLMQSSDWAFIMTSGTTVAYAERRLREHVHRFRRLDDELVRGTLDDSWLAEIEARDNLFPQLDYRVYT
jgi:1,4-alpha-glucan branching enzyme